MKLVIAISLSISAWAQITASPTDITVYMRQSDLNFTPTQNFIPVPITITGTGSWNITRGGTLASACPAVNGYCVNLSTSPTASTATPLPTGSDAGTVYLYGQGIWQLNLTPGSYTGTFAIGATTVNVTLVVMERNAYQAFSYLPGFPSGCSNTDIRYADLDTCTITTERPTSMALAIPAVGGSYTDAQFGYPIKRLTASKNNVEYSGATAFSATGKYVVTTAAGGDNSTNIYNRATGALVYAAVPVSNIDATLWDPYDDERIWYLQNGTIRYITLTTGIPTTAADYTLSSGARPALTALSMGGTEDITDDGWLAVTSNNNVCSVNFNDLTTGTQESKILCYDYSGLGLTFIDFPQITQVDRESGKRYVMIIAEPVKPVFSVGSSALTFEYSIPGGGIGIAGTPHSDVTQDDEGRQQFCWHWEDSQVNANAFACVALNKGADVVQPVEIGGGLNIDSIVQISSIYDAHFGCNWKGICVSEVYGGTGTGGLTAWKISSVTAATPCAITTDLAHGYSTGNLAIIAGGEGITSINAQWTITVTGATTFTLDGHTCSGVYTANSARVTTAGNATTRSHRQELTIYRVGQDARRLGTHRSKNFDNPLSYLDAFGYWAGPRASISRDGRYVAYASNMGNPEWPSVYILDAAIDYTVRMRASVDPAGTSAILNYTLPAGQGAATVTISSSPTLTSPVVSASDSLTTAGRQYVATGLTAGTLYYYRVQTTGYSFSGQFVTLPTQSGSGRVQLSKGGGGSIGYGPTTSLGSSCTSPCDITATRGILYNNASGAVRAVVVR